MPSALADVRAFDHRRLADVEAAAAEREVVDRRRLDLPAAGHADQRRGAAVVELEPVGEVARQHGRLRRRCRS